LARTRPGSINSLLVRAQREPEVGRIDAHERRAALHRFTGIDQAFQDLSRNTEPEIALNASCDDSREGALRLGGALDEACPNQRSLRSRVC
jgi:hypothetical protein